MAKDTKQRILEAALAIFSENGYEGTSIQDIADAVGIVKSALYRHFQSKEDIRSAVFDMMIAYYGERIGSAGNLSAIPQSTGELYDMTMRMVNFTVHDQKVIEMRKLLLKDQFHDERTRRLASRYFLYDIESTFTRIFEGMMRNGSIVAADPAVLAFAYTAPVTSLIHLCDREPEKEGEAMAKLDRFLLYFTETYGAEK